MSEPAKKGGIIKYFLTATLGLGSGVVAMYSNALVNQIAKPQLPVANFAVTADGLTVTCQNRAAGDSGWWDFGDGSPLEPFDPNQQTVTHGYAAPGSYAVKLIVRNFLLEQNDRSVPVTVAAAPATTSTEPKVLSLDVKPVSPVSVAPATFRVTAEVQNAEHCVWDFGDKLEVTDGGGKIDRLVTIEKAGAFPVQLVAVNAKAAAKETRPVKVDAPQQGTMMALLKVTDTGAKVDRMTVTESVAVPAPKDKASPAFSKAVAARPGWSVVSAAPANPNPPGVKNLKVEVAADKKSVTVSGEWAGDPKAGKAASDVILLKFVQERSIPMNRPPVPVTGLFLAGGQATLPLPAVPAGLTGGKRELTLEIKQFMPSGPPRTVASTTLTPQPAGKPMWSTVIDMGGTKCQFQATQQGETLQVSYTVPGR